MKPKKQAEKIYSDIIYHLELRYGTDNIHNKGVARAAAYIAVREIINELVINDTESRFDYWMNVLKEIQEI